MTPLVLMILDGYGISSSERGNAIKYAKTPNLDKIFSSYPVTKLSASGLNVGLPNGQMGNSEVGHTNIGAGRVVFQDLARISQAIEEEYFFDNPEINAAINNAIENDSALHIMGLLSNGGIHSHIEHLFALIRLAKKRNVKKLYIHAFLDGRDTSPKSGANFLGRCLSRLTGGTGKVATVMGRYYAMDRDNRYDRVQKAYEAMVLGYGDFHRDPVEGVLISYEEGITDEFVKPMVCYRKGKIKDNDSVIFFNFRPDRAREITRSLVDPDFEGFKRKRGSLPKNLKFVCMTQYDATMPNVSVAFKPEELTNTLGEYLSKKGKTQLRIAETEKYAHVTFFFNGGEEVVFKNEDRVLIPSPSVATYDLQPEMSAYKVKEEVIKRIESKKYDVIILNFANCDMVGHTGVLKAAIKAVEAVDECVGEIYKVMSDLNATLLITADHGNAEQMLDQGGNIFTAHTTNLVPFCVVNFGCDLKNNGSLCDIAPTILEILGLEKPSEMNGNSLLLNVTERLPLKEEIKPEIEKIEEQAPAEKPKKKTRKKTNTDKESEEKKAKKTKKTSKKSSKKKSEEE